MSTTLKVDDLMCGGRIPGEAPVVSPVTTSNSNTATRARSVPELLTRKTSIIKKERSEDFNEKAIKLSPTFKKWENLKCGQRMRYFCRNFVKGHGDDEELLMRRIMTARRNNLRKHEILKRARNLQTQKLVKDRSKKVSKGGINDNMKNQITSNPFMTLDIRKKPKILRSAEADQGITGPPTAGMNDCLVKATRSYKAWEALETGQVLTYSRNYVKGKEGHDWLLRKHIWRRMMYRKRNKHLVSALENECATKSCIASCAPGAPRTTMSDSAPNTKLAMTPKTNKIKATVHL